MSVAFSIRMADGSTFLDENDVEAYDATANQFALTRDASIRMVANWEDFAALGEEVRPRGAFFDADNAAFEVVLGDRQIARGTVISGMLMFGAPPMPAVVLYGDFPLVQEGRVHVGIGIMNDFEDVKRMVEAGPSAALAPVLACEVAERFRALGKLR